MPLPRLEAHIHTQSPTPASTPASTCVTPTDIHTGPEERSAPYVHPEVIAGSSEVTMADVFSLNDARKLLKDRFMLMIGDSNTRAIYKDLLCLLHEGVITPEVILRRGSESAPQYGDEIIDIATTMYGRSYFEVRQCKRKRLWVRFIFVTQAAAPTLLKELERLEAATLPPPAIVVLNSCLWDLTRWGPEQEDQYKCNVARLFHRLRSILPPSTMVVWLASLPVATERVKGGVFIQQIEFVKHSMRFMLLEANMFLHNLCRVFGFSFLDLHYYMQFQLNRRTNDGLHWEPPAIRFITNILLTHIALTLNEPLPGNVSDTFLLRHHDKAREEGKDDNKKIYLDSKITRYLKEELGVEVKNLADEEQMSARDSEMEKKEPPKGRAKKRARRTARTEGTSTTTTKNNNNNNNNSQPAPATQPPSFQQELIDFPPNSRTQGRVLGPQDHSMPPWVSGHCGHWPVLGRQEGTSSGQYYTDMQVEGPHGQYFSGGGSDLSWFRERPLPGLGIESQFSSMHMTGGPADYGHQPMNMMHPQPFHVPQYPESQPYQHQFSLNPNEFWHDYPVNNFPWNQQH